MKDEIIRVRVEPDLKEKIKEKSMGNMSDYLRGLAIRDIKVELNKE